MRTNRFKFLLIILLMFVSLIALSSCFSNLEESGSFYINKVITKTINIGEQIEFDDMSYSSNTDVFSMNNNIGYAKSVGTVEIRKVSNNMLTYYITVENKPQYITVNSNCILKVNDVVDLEIAVSPITSDQEVIFTSYDEEIISIDENKQLKALKEGFTTVEVVSKNYPSVKTKFAILVQNNSDENYEDQFFFNNEIFENIELNANDYNELLNALSLKSLNSLIGIEKYERKNGRKELTDFGSGIIYRRDAILKDGTIEENVSFGDDFSNLDTFKYYVISTRNLVQNTEQVKVYLGEKIGSCSAKVIQYDDKIDLAVLTFESLFYLDLAVLGDSSLTKQGEFIISIGNSDGKSYFRSSTFGIVSHTKRYISTDTDGDQVSDWDSEYIQHDATINSGDNGGAIINMKGEVIGINSTKLISMSNSVNCMSFAIPINVTKEIVAMLENGVKPQRAILGVSIIDVRAFYQNKDLYLINYPQMSSIPDGLEYGFYVSDVTAGGVAHMAKVQIGDILLEFNGVTTKFSYQLRAELGKFIIGSGEKAYLKVYRNGQIITLEVVF